MNTKILFLRVAAQMGYFVKWFTLKQTPHFGGIYYVNYDTIEREREQKYVRKYILRVVVLSDRPKKAMISEALLKEPIYNHARDGK